MMDSFAFEVCEATDSKHDRSEYLSIHDKGREGFTSMGRVVDMEWLTSGFRRDICILLYDGECRAQQLKSDLEGHYDRRVKPDRFYGAIDTLEAKGFLDTRVDGLEDVYSLTDPGRARVEAQFDWMCDQLDT